MNATGHAGMGKRNAFKKKPPQQYSQKRTPSHTYKKKKKGNEMKVLRRRLHEMANSKGKKQTEEEKTHMKKKKKATASLKSWWKKKFLGKESNCKGASLPTQAKKERAFSFFFFDFVGMQKGLIPTRLPLCVQSVLLCKGHKTVLRRVATCKK